MNNLNYNQKLSLLHNLLTLARADRIESENEVDFIYHIGAKLNILRADIDGLMSKKVAFHPPKEEHQRIVLFYTFLVVMRIDDHLSKEEISVCKEIGFRLGLNPFAVQNLLEQILDNPKKKIPSIDVVSFFKLYHN